MDDTVQIRASKGSVMAIFSKRNYLLICTLYVTCEISASRLPMTKITRNSTMREATFHRRFTNAKLRLHHVPTVHNVPIQLCIRACLADPTCESVNYNRTGLNCELLNVTAARGGFVSRAYGWDHYQALEKRYLPCHLYKLTGTGGDQAINLYGQQLDESNVHRYCDLTIDGGGWTIIGRHARQKSQTDEERVNLFGSQLKSIISGDFLLTLDGFEFLWKNFAFRQLRWFCHRSSDGLKMDIITKDDAMGDKVMEYARNADAPKPASCNSYYSSEQSSPSYTEKYCHLWEHESWYFQKNDRERIHRYPVHIQYLTTYDPITGSCDNMQDANDESLYTIYVR